VLEFNYRVIQLNRLNWRDFLNQRNPVASALMAKMKIAPSERAKVKAECLRLLVTLKLNPAKMQLISGFVDTYLRLQAEEEQEFQKEIAKFNPQQKEESMEIVTSWMEKGIEQGMEREKQFIIRQIKRKFGNIEEELQAQIKALNIDVIETLGEDLFDLTSIDDLKQWLNNL
jgi:predicted transposase YdaD